MDNKYYENYRRFTYSFSYEDQEKYSEYEAALEELEGKEVIANELYEEEVSRLEAANDYDGLERYRYQYVSESDYYFTKEEILNDMKGIQTMYRVTEEQLAEDKRIRAMYSRDRLRLIKANYVSRGQDNIMRDVDVDALSDDEAIEMYRNVRHGLSSEDDRRIGNELVRRRVARFEGQRGNAGGTTGGATGGTTGGNDNGGNVSYDEDGNPIYSEEDYGLSGDGLDYEKLQDLGMDEHGIRTYDDAPHDRGGNGGSSGGGSGDGGTTDGGAGGATGGTSNPATVETEIAKFNAAAANIEKQIKEIREKLVLGDGIDLDVTQAIKGLDSELKDLDNMAKLILDDIDEFKREVGEANFSMTPAEIVAKVKGFRSRLNELKKTHKEKYNARVELTNEKIRELKGMTGLDTEVADMIANLVELERCEQKIAWNSTNYLNQIDYNKLIEVNKLIAEIERKLGKGPKTPEVEGLDADIEHIENEVQRIGTEVVENMPQDEIDRLKQDMQVVDGLINDFRQKLEANKDKISTEEYDKYKARADKAEADLNELRNKLGIKVEDKKVNDELVRKAKELGYDVDRLANDIEDFFGKIVKAGAEQYEARHNTLVGRVSDFKNEVEEKYKNGEIDENQYKSLMAKIDEMNNKLANALNKLRDPGMVKGADIFEIINKDINKLDDRLTNLEHKVENTAKFKKDDRKVVDKEIEELENEAKRIESVLEHYKQNDPVKYEAAVRRLDEIKNRLNEVKKNYRSKCPLLVRAVRGAKDFYKKHKKACLIVAGLAAIALLHATVGPVLIPAIMHGNIMVGLTSPMLRPFVEFSNKILGGMIGATMNPSSGAWFLANGVSLNPSVAATSLLKGLAISAGGHALLVAPIIVAIKALVNKMKTAEHKMKLVDAEKLKKKLEDAKGKLKKSDKPKKSSGNDDGKKAGKRAHKEMLELISKYYKSGMSLEEFCETEKISDDEKQFLEGYDASIKEKMNNAGRGGRK